MADYLEVEDSAEISLVFDEELMGSLHLNYNQRPSKHTLEIIGTDGTINWDYYQNTVNLFEFDETESIKQESYVCPDSFDRNDLFVQEMNHFREVIEGKAKPRCTLDDGIKALNMAMKAKERGLM